MSDRERMTGTEIAALFSAAVGGAQIEVQETGAFVLVLIVLTTIDDIDDDAGDGGTWVRCRNDRATLERHAELVRVGVELGNAVQVSELPSSDEAAK